MSTVLGAKRGFFLALRTGWRLFPLFFRFFDRFRHQISPSKKNRILVFSTFQLSSRNLSLRHEVTTNIGRCHIFQARFV
jgi:hypothetical protein